MDQRPRDHDPDHSNPGSFLADVFREGILGALTSGLRIVFTVMAIGGACGGLFGLVKGLGLAALFPAAIGAVAGLVFGLVVLLSPLDF